MIDYHNSRQEPPATTVQPQHLPNRNIHTIATTQNQSETPPTISSLSHQHQSSSSSIEYYNIKSPITSTTTTDSMMHSFGSMAEMKREERHHLPPTYDHQRGKKDDGERATNDNIILQENNKRRNVPSYSYYLSRNNDFVPAFHHQQQPSSSDTPSCFGSSKLMQQSIPHNMSSSNSITKNVSSKSLNDVKSHHNGVSEIVSHHRLIPPFNNQRGTTNNAQTVNHKILTTPNSNNALIVNYNERVQPEITTKENPNYVQAMYSKVHANYYNQPPPQVDSTNFLMREGTFYSNGNYRSQDNAHQPVNESYLEKSIPNRLSETSCPSQQYEINQHLPAPTQHLENATDYSNTRQSKWSSYEAYRDHPAAYKHECNPNKRSSIEEHNKTDSNMTTMYPSVEERAYLPGESACNTHDGTFSSEQHSRLNSVSNDDQTHSNLINVSNERQSSNTVTLNTYNYQQPQDDANVSSEHLYDDRFSPHLTYDGSKTNVEEYTNSKSGVYSLYHTNSQNDIGSIPSNAYIQQQDEVISYPTSEKGSLTYTHHPSLEQEHRLHSNSYYLDTSSSSYIQHQMATTNAPNHCNDYQNAMLEPIATTHQYNPQASPEHLPPTPYSYNPSTPCPSQQIQQQPMSLKRSSNYPTSSLDDQTVRLQEATSSIPSPDHYPLTPYSSDPPTPYATNGVICTQHGVYCSPDHEHHKDGKLYGAELDHLPPTPYSLDLCSPNSEHSGELISNPTRSLINKVSHHNDNQQNQPLFPSTKSPSMVENLTQRDKEIISLASNDKNLISQKSHKEIKELSLQTLKKTTNAQCNGQKQDLITNDPSTNSDLLDTNTDKMTKSYHQVNEDVLSHPFKESSSEALLKNDSKIYSDARTLGDKVPHIYCSNMVENFNEDISANQTVPDQVQTKDNKEVHNTPLQQNLSLLKFEKKMESTTTKIPKKRSYPYTNSMDTSTKKSPAYQEESPYNAKEANKQVSASFSTSLPLYRQLAQATTANSPSNHHIPSEGKKSSSTINNSLKTQSTKKPSHRQYFDCTRPKFSKILRDESSKNKKQGGKLQENINREKESRETSKKDLSQEIVRYNPYTLDAVFDEVINDFNTFLPHGKEIGINKDSSVSEVEKDEVPTNAKVNSKMVHLEFSILTNNKIGKITRSNSSSESSKEKNCRDFPSCDGAKNVNVCTVMTHDDAYIQQDMGHDSSGVSDTFFKLQSKQALFCEKSSEEATQKDVETKSKISSATLANIENSFSQHGGVNFCLSSSHVEIKTSKSSNVSSSLNRETNALGGQGDDIKQKLAKTDRKTPEKYKPFSNLSSDEMTIKSGSQGMKLPFNSSPCEKDNFSANKDLYTQRKIFKVAHNKETFSKGENGTRHLKTISYSNLDSSNSEIDKEFEKQVLRGQISINSRQEHEQDKLHHHQIHRENQIAKRKRYDGIVMYGEENEEKSGFTKNGEEKLTSIMDYCSKVTTNETSSGQGRYAQTENKLLEFSVALSSKDNDEKATRLKSEKRRKISGHTLNNSNNSKLVEDKDLDHKDEEKEKELPTKRLETITLPLSLESSEKDLQLRSDLLKFFGTNGKIKRIMSQGEEEKDQFPSPRCDNDLQFKHEKRPNSSTDDVTFKNELIPCKVSTQQIPVFAFSNSIVKKSNNNDTGGDANAPSSRNFTFKCSRCPAEFPLRNITDICEHVLTESSKQQLEMGIHNSTRGGVVGGGILAKFSKIFRYFSYRVKLFVTPAICQVQAHCVIVCLSCRREFGKSLSSTSSASSSMLLSSPSSKAEGDCNHLAKTLFQHLVSCHEFEDDVKNKNFCIFCDKRAMNINQHMIDYEHIHIARLNALAIFGCSKLNNRQNVSDNNLATSICQCCDKSFRHDVRLPDWLSRSLCSFCISKLILSINSNGNGNCGINSPGMTKISDKLDKSRKNTLVVLCSFCRQGKYGHHILLPLKDKTAYINGKEFVQNVKRRKNEGRTISNSSESRQRPTSICVNCLEIYDTFTKKILMLSSIDAKENIYTSDKDKNNSKSGEGEIIYGIPSKIGTEECENYFEKMLNDLVSACFTRLHITHFDLGRI